MKSGDISELEDLLNSQKTLAYRATALINTLEDYALLDREVSFGPVSLTNVVEAAHDNLATLIIDRHAVVDFDELPMIHGHQPQLIQLFQNLIQNGLKYNDSQIPWIGIGIGIGREQANFCEEVRSKPKFSIKETGINCSG